jgi:hypothetical protein
MSLLGLTGELYDAAASDTNRRRQLTAQWHPVTAYPLLTAEIVSQPE